MSAITNQTKNLGYTAPQPMKNAGTPNPAALRAAKAMETLALVAFGELFKFFLETPVAGRVNDSDVEMVRSKDGRNVQVCYLKRNDYFSFANTTLQQELPKLCPKQRTVLNVILSRVDALAESGLYVSYYKSFPNFNESIRQDIEIIREVENVGKLSNSRLIQSICVDLVQKRIKT